MDMWLTIQGVGLGFGPDVTRRWCELNKITAIIRSHEVRQDGYAIEHDGLCITTFSCPNYCDSTGNKVCLCAGVGRRQGGSGAKCATGLPKESDRATTSNEAATAG